MSTIASTVKYDQLFCPSLQDTCKLYLLATIHEYPVDILAKLPLHMRKKLFMAMPVIDRVHFVGTTFLAGLEVVEYKDFVSSWTTSNTMFPACVFLSTKDSATIKADLVSALFGQLKEKALAKLCFLNLQNAFGSFDCFNSSSMKDNTDPHLILRLVHQIIHSLHYCRLNAFHSTAGYSDLYPNNFPSPTNYSRDKAVLNAIIVPCRPFILPLQPAYGSSVSRGVLNQPLELQNYEYFAKYCQLASSVPAHLEIDPIDFLCSPIWRDYKLTRDEAAKRSQAKGISDITAVDPFVCKPIYPYLQELLCTVEYLTLGTNANIEFAEYNTYNSYIAIPYILMSAITANSSLASLKSISVYGITEGAVLALSAIAGFLIGSDYFASSSSYYVESNGFYYKFSPPEGDPFLIESLSFKASNATVSDSRSVSKVLKAVVSKQMDSMKNISVL